MNKTYLIVAASLASVIAAGSAHAFKITWTGSVGTTDAFDEGNWISALTQAPPEVGVVDPGKPINLIIEVTDALTPVNSSGGALTIGPAGVFQLTGSLLVSSDIIRRDDTPDTDDQLNAPMIISDSLINPVNVIARGVNEVDIALIDSLTLFEGDDPLRFSSIVFSTSSTSDPMLTLTNESVGDVVAEHLSKFSVGGAAFPAVVGSDPSVIEPGDNLLIISDGGVGSIVTPIADPLPLLPGDTDNDGDVDDSDLGSAFANYTGPVGSAGEKTAADGDTDSDGDVDDSDLGSAFASYTGPRAPVMIPEPSSFLLLLLGGLVAIRRF